MLGRFSVLLSAIVTTFVTLVISVLYWGVPYEVLGGASLRGVLLAAEIGLIIASALVIVEILKHQKLFHSLQLMLERLSGDYRVQTLLIGFALIYFIEGMAGFGTPMIVALPILVALGMKPLHATIVTLIAATVPGVFGGIGLPITYGIQSVISSSSADAGAIMSELIHLAALWYIPATMVLALTIVGVITWLRRESFRSFVEIVPFATVASLTISIPAALTAYFIGPELPTALGGLVGLVCISFMSHHRILTPRTVIRHDKEAPVIAGKAMKLPELGKILWPYLLLIVLLIVSRMPSLGLADTLQQWRMGFSNIFGSGIDYSFAPLYSAPALLFMVAVCTLIVFRLQGYRKEKVILKEVQQRITRPVLTLMVVLVFVQLFIYSNGTHVAATMPSVIAEGFASISGAAWPFVAPFMGAVGAGVAGSTTMSNLIFSGLQFDIAMSLGLSVVGVLLLQLFGAALGNMIALHNIVAALAVAGISEKESHKIIKSNGKVLLVLVTLCGLIGLAILAV